MIYYPHYMGVPLNRERSGSIGSVYIDAIPNSCAKLSPQVTFGLENGAQVIASAPAAITAGRREIRLTDQAIPSLRTKPAIQELVVSLKESKYKTQEDFDTKLKELTDTLVIGPDVSLAFSLAFARFSAISQEISLEE